MTKSIDDMLEGNDEPQVETPRDESGRFASDTGVDQAPEPEPVPPTEPAADHLPKDVYEPLRAIRDENKSLKDQLAKLTEQITSNQPQPEPPSIWEDETAWQQNFGAQVAQQATVNATLQMSEMLNRHKHEDFEPMKASFLEMCQQNPAIAQQALADPDPWGKAYQIAKNAAKFAEYGATDVEALKAKLREEILAEATQSVPVKAPPSLGAARNVGSRSGPAWSGPSSLEELLG